MSRTHAMLAVLATVALGDEPAAAESCAAAIERAESRLADGAGDPNRADRPAESWFEPAPSPRGARSLIDNARDLERQGNSRGCLEMMGQAERMIEGFREPPPKR